jgi:HK97 family phage major capsid protein
MTDINMNEFTSALNELRSEFDKKSQDFGKIEKIEAILEKQEKANQDLIKSQQEATKKAEEIETKYNALEAEVKRPAFGGAADEAKAELKAYEAFLCKGKDGMSEAERKYYRTDNNTQGGYLVPVEQSSEIIKKITEISPIRSVAKVRTMSSKSLRMPVRSALITSGYVGEGVTNSLSQSLYGREELVAKKLSVSAEISIEELQDATPNMITEIGADVAEEFARQEGAAFVNGSGVNTPEGFMTNSDIPEINSGGASNIDFDNFSALEGELKTGYNAIYGFNRRTLAAIRNLKDGSNTYIWRAGNLGAGLPNAINGTSYIEVPDMPNIGAGTYPVILGDFARGYLIGDRAGFSVIRDDVTKAREGKVVFTYMARHDGMVVLPESFIKLKVSA